MRHPKSRVVSRRDAAKGDPANDSRSANKLHLQPPTPPRLPTPASNMMPPKNDLIHLLDPRERVGQGLSHFAYSHHHQHHHHHRNGNLTALHIKHREVSSNSLEYKHTGKDRKSRSALDVYILNLQEPKVLCVVIIITLPDAI